MDTATEPNRNGKRVKFAQEKNSSSSPPSTAIDCAKFAASVTIKPLAEHYFKEFIALKIELYQLAKTKVRLANEDFVPTSARIKFELNATERVKEQAPAALTTLIDSAELTLGVFKADIKKKVIQLLDLEIKVASNALKLLFCNAVCSLGVATGIHVYNCDNFRSRYLITATMEAHPELLQHTGISSRDATRTATQEFFGLVKTIVNDNSDEHIVGTLDPAHLALVAPTIPDFKSTLEALFVRSWTQYLSKKAESTRQIAVKTFVEEELKESITSEVAMDLEGIAADPSKLEQYISSKIAEGTRTLRATVDRLSDKSPRTKSKSKTEKATPNTAKNKPGAQTSNAPKRNPRDQKTTKKKKEKSPKAAAPPAAAAAKDSTNANGGNRNSGKSNRGKRNNNSARKQTQRS
jgi:hypothetical protein